MRRRENEGEEGLLLLPVLFIGIVVSSGKVKRLTARDDDDGKVYDVC